MSYVLGVIGGSGLYRMEGLESHEEIKITTPFGVPSDKIVRGKLGNTTMLFLPRHGRGHRIAPSNINYRANIHALKQLGATHVVSVSAVGSLREEIEPRHLVIPSQFIDRTQRRDGTFFDAGIVVHVSMADPVCPDLARALTEAARSTGATVHTDKTYVCIEGPRFSTRAESHAFRAMGADIIGMTNVPEAFLAREARLPYATLALSTDYDCWRPHDEVEVQQILAIVHDNVARAQQALQTLAASLPDPSTSPARKALDGAILTRLDEILHSDKERYLTLLGDKLPWP
ncbi:MAG: S-methyl-5'-thioadenosine phosphorylase [Polyangiaceae bacterium]